MTKNDEEIKTLLVEWIGENSENVPGEEFLCVRSFFLPVRPGPLVSVPRGDHVILKTPALIRQLFIDGKIEPFTIPDGMEYVTRCGFRWVIDGCWKDIHQNDVLKLSRAEALDLLRKRLVVPLDPAIFRLK